MRRLGCCIVLSVLLCAVVSSAAEKDEALDKVRSLGTFIEDDEYQKALNLIDALQSDIYVLSVNKERPEIDSTTYINHYFKFQISNPVSEWTLKQIVLEDPVFEKKTRITKDLVKIENPQSSYGLNEQLVVSAYDIGNSSEAQYVSRLDFKPELYLKNMADRLLQQNKRADSETQEKEAFILKGNPAYTMTVETDVGFEKKVVTKNILVFVTQYKYVLIMSFAMYAENYGIYKNILNEILDTIVIGQGYDSKRSITQRSFMDIYLERGK